MFDSKSENRDSAVEAVESGLGLGLEEVFVFRVRVRVRIRAKPSSQG